ncbi:hypothetical protein FRC06_011532 [Ceratobasidium sp. 370]|nr:hypothetical protein FRC06_011532 [Ceratobasidium sp. 370]
MPAIEPVSPSLADITQETEQLGLESDRQRRVDNDSDDEFHDACDRAPQPEADDVEEFTEAEILEIIKTAEASKAEGNKLYINDKMEEAKQSYSYGLSRVPKRKRPPRSPPPSNPASTGKDGPAREEGEKVEPPPPTELEQRAASLRAQLNSLLDDPKYVKALQRRASSNEIIGSWSALSSAESDYTTLLEILPPSSQPPIRLALARLKPRVLEAKERETAEMMGKLKDLGNNILGRFGLSTDNFQFTPNGQGGYGLNFVR